ncbi:Short-chain dehydrogenase/reductase family 42E member 1 [Lamellibrachia satsuma]|nr:Short-chain dehydrogenase/reductase family 42E member 1 [Lamellibrachia satsuma]
MVTTRNSSRGQSRLPETHLITGGAGYLGMHLALGLRQRGHLVRLFDWKEPTVALPEGIIFVKGDVTSQQDVEEGVEGVDCVYHLASFGMSGREQLNTHMIEAVNMTGTDNVIKACRKFHVNRLIYTSTYNVVFGGQKIVNGDESLPYWPLEKHPDHYSRTKAQAEMRVLAAHDSSGANTLQTCALRLAGVYGPGEERHLPRVVHYVQQGWFGCTYGEEDSLVDFLHVDNVVEAHVLSGETLAKSGNSAAGQAYFISDGKPVNNFEFFRPLIEGLGYRFPRIRVPFAFVYFIAYLIEWLHFLAAPVHNFQPLLTRAEVFKTGVTHYFSIAKAQKDLHYNPKVQNDMQSALAWFLERGYAKKTALPKKRTLKRLFLDLLLAATFVVVLLSFLPSVR